MTRRELSGVAVGVLLLMSIEAALNDASILFGRYLWFDELQIKLIASQPGLWHSMAAVAHSGDETPQPYYLLARAAWRVAEVFGASGETAFRALAFGAMWLALVLTYAVLRRSFSALPALIAVLLLWACPVTTMYAFFARPYAILMASTAAFCLVYGADEVRASSLVAIAACAMFLCGIHYFGIISLASIVVVDMATRREQWRSRQRRLLAAAAGPLVWIPLLPVFRAQIASYDPRTFLFPLTFKFAAVVIFNMFEVPVLIMLGMLAGGWIGRILFPQTIEGPTAGSTKNLQPVVGMIALLLVPFAILLISIKENHFLDRYMITALLGLTPIAAMIASRLARPFQIAIALLVIVLGAATVRVAATGWSQWQTATQDLFEECIAMASDGVPVVALTSLEAYPLYEYAPELRKNLYFVDLLPTHRRDLTPGTLNDATCFRKWQRVVPDAPKVVTLADLVRIGKFHVVFKTEWQVMKNGPLPFRKVEGFGNSGTFRVDPGYRNLVAEKEVPVALR